MQTDLQKEIASLEYQIDCLEKELDAALGNDLKLGEAKKLFHEIKILKAKLSGMNQVNPSL